MIVCAVATLAILLLFDVQRLEGESPASDPELGAGPLSGDAQIYRRVVDELRVDERPLIVQATKATGDWVVPSPGGALWEELAEFIDGWFPSDTASEIARQLTTPEDPRLPQELDAFPEIVLYDPEVDFHHDEGWERFHKRFPGAGGYLVFSPVAWSADRSRALVFVTALELVLSQPPEGPVGSMPRKGLGYYLFDLSEGDPPRFFSTVVE